MTDQPAGDADDLLPAQTSDDTDRGWGEDWRPGSDPDGDEDLERFRREKPPHW